MTLRGPPTQLSKVLDALEGGCDTVRTIEIFTGLPRKQCSAYLSMLRKIGNVEVVPGPPIHVSHLGRPMHRYRLVAPRVAE